MKKIISLRSGTCTDRATKFLISNNKNFSDYEIMYVNSFKEGIKLMIESGGPEDRLLIPDVSDQYREVVMHKRFDKDIQSAFWYKNPPLYLAKRKDSISNKTCATLPVLQNLINDEYDFIYKDNTQESAEYCLDGKSDLCVTNQNGLDTNDLEFVEVLKSIDVYWMPFKIV